MKKDKLNAFQLFSSSVEILPVDNITKSVLMDLFLPKRTPYYQAIQIVINTHPSQLDAIRSEIYCYPPVVCSLEQVGLWSYALDYLIREYWNSKNKIPVPKESNLMEPLGDLLCSVLRILHYLDGFMGEFNPENIHLMNMFSPIALEIFEFYFSVPESGGKNAKSTQIRRYAEMIRCHEKPIGSEAYPKFHDFINTIVTFSEMDKTNHFKRQFLTKNTPKGLVTALSTIAGQFNTDKRLAIVDVSKDSLKYNYGSGKGGVTFTKASLKKLLS